MSEIEVYYFSLGEEGQEGWEWGVGGKWKEQEKKDGEEEENEEEEETFVGRMLGVKCRIRDFWRSRFEDQKDCLGSREQELINHFFGAQLPK